MGLVMIIIIFPLTLRVSDLWYWPRKLDFQEINLSVIELGSIAAYYLESYMNIKIYYHGFK